MSIGKNEKPLHVLQATHTICNFKTLFEPCHTAHVDPGIAFVRERFRHTASSPDHLLQRDVEAGAGPCRGDEHPVARTVHPPGLRSQRRDVYFPKWITFGWRSPKCSQNYAYSGRRQLLSHSRFLSYPVRSKHTREFPLRDVASALEAPSALTGRIYSQQGKISISKTQC